MIFILNTLCHRLQLQYRTAMSDIDDDNLNVGENVLPYDINDNLEGGSKRTNGTGRGRDTEGIELTQDDATCRLTWQGYPFFV